MCGRTKFVEHLIILIILNMLNMSKINLVNLILTLLSYLNLLRLERILVMMKNDEIQILSSKWQCNNVE